MPPVRINSGNTLLALDVVVKIQRLKFFFTCSFAADSSVEIHAVQDIGVISQFVCVACFTFVKVPNKIRAFYWNSKTPFEPCRTTDFCNEIGAASDHTKLTHSIILKARFL